MLLFNVSDLSMFPRGNLLLGHTVLGEPRLHFFRFEVRLIVHAHHGHVKLGCFLAHFNTFDLGIS